MPSNEDNTKADIPAQKEPFGLPGKTEKAKDEEYAGQLRAFRESLAEERDRLEPGQFTKTADIDVAAFVRAQSDFIKAQTYFMQPRGGPDDALHRVTQFSLAQTKFISAQNEVLAQLGVV